MSLTARHRWCIDKIATAFAAKIDDEAMKVKVQGFIRVPANLEKFNQFFKGDGPQKLFVFYQTPEVPGADVDDWSPEKGTPEIFISSGASTRLAAKCCAFVRNVAPGTAIDNAGTSDATLLFCELADTALGSVQAYLHGCFRPIFESSDQWGRADDEQRTDFLGEMEHFTHNVQEALNSLVGGLELKKPDIKAHEALNARNFTQQAKQNPELIPHFEELLEGWCNQIQEYLSDEPGQDKKKDDDDGETDVGPRAELEHWRNRMQRLTSIAEQLKRKDCKNVIGLLSTLTKNSADPSKQKVIALLRRWKQIDVNITEAANEAKDNVKYLFTLERFIEPLYTGTATTIIDTLPALTNSIKMIHTIARYYSTTERMTNLFARITDQMIVNCKQSITEGEGFDTLWEKRPQELVRQLESCLKLSEAYQEQYRLTKKKLQQMPKGKQFDFNEMQIFGKFDLFCRRIIKLIDMFSTIDQFTSLSRNKLEGMEDLIEQFHAIVKDFRQKRHDLLDYHNNKFDRDYVEFNVKISDLEGSLQHFINQSFENITSIENSLNLLHKFQAILQRETLKSDLDSKLNIIFQNYGIELEQVQQLYEKQKHDPPVPRNLPPVAGNITWSRHLLKRIEEPMKQFEANQNVLDGQGARRIIKMYNKLARTLVAFEYLWHQAWVQSLDQAKSGLQATLIIRHPEDGKLYVNFDLELLQLVREAKCLDRMGIEIPEAAKIVLFQEEKLKSYFNDLHWALNEYDRIVTMVIPVTAMVLRPHFNDMEYKLRPGMITLTWTSMNIDTYKSHVHLGLRKLEQLVTNINDIIEHRIEKNLKIVSRTLLVDLPENKSFSVEEFVRMQQQHITAESNLLQGKNVEIEHAVEDLVKIITGYAFDSHVEHVSEDEIVKLKKHYNHFMYQALLHCAKNSMNALKKRIASRVGTKFLYVTRPFFEVDVQLAPPQSVILQPSLDDIQECINRSAQAILQCFKTVNDWYVVVGDGRGPGLSSSGADKAAAEAAGKSPPSFFERITKDIEIVRVALLLTGCVQGIRNTVADYLASFAMYDWVWKKDKDEAYREFIKADPTLDDYESQLKSFVNVDGEIDAIHSIYNIGALSLNTRTLKEQLKSECQNWKVTYSDNLHSKARDRLEGLSEYMRVTLSKLHRQVVDLDTLRFMMNLFKEVRERESGIDMEIQPVMDMYQMLEYNLPAGFMEKTEIDKKTVLRANWKKLIKQAAVRAEELSRTQRGFKAKLIRDVHTLKTNVEAFRGEFTKNGPGVPGIEPDKALARLNRCKEELAIMVRKFELYSGGEDLFAMPQTEYPMLQQTLKEVKLFDQLFGLYTDVRNSMHDWADLSWAQVPELIDDMTTTMDGFALRCKKMPGKLRQYDAFQSLKKQIEDFQVVLPLLQDLAKPCIMPRHWEELRELTKQEFDENSAEFKLQSLLDLHLENVAEDVGEITDGAEKQLKIEIGLKEINDIWAVKEFAFKEWKSRPVPTLQGTGLLMEELEEAQMNVQTMLTMRHVAPFREEATEMLASLSDASETLERWVKVQLMWCSLESVFTGGDIAKQLPMEAKKFGKVDKDWGKIMQKSAETKLVVECCANELLKTSLPTMSAELEKCQKSLEGYLEAKRSKFPRFYFCSNSKLLIILSQGSDPLNMNEHYETVFDALERVEHDKKDKTIIHKIHGSGGNGHEVVPFITPVKASGNIEDWLCDLLYKMQLTVKDHTAVAGSRIASQGPDTSQLRTFVDSTIAQLALLGIQFMWTTDTQTALEECSRKKNAMKEVNARQIQVLLELSSWCLQDLGPKVNRKKIETLVTVHVHQRDVTTEMFTLFKQKKIKDANDFEWTKQARFYWRANGSDECSEDGTCVISITDVDFAYCYEYLGSKERLVITPLTDRCYITLAQALGMCFGGAPAGPAGTGKTETTKDLGNTLGTFVVVQNCGDQMSYKDCAKIFKGLCQSGLWGCFDEFNRIRLPVLSVVAQQVLAIQNAKKTGTPIFQFPGDPQDVTLNKSVAYYITMNPGYAGRQELPENLKALFRGVMMMVPDFRIIKKVKLCSVGYDEYEMLATKFFVLYDTCKMQLSNQKHYDWGLRNILAVLRTCGANKRLNLDKPESFLLYQTLRDMNLSKLVAQDVPLFLSILADLFPAIPPPPKVVYEDVERELQQSVESDGLIFYEGPAGSEGTRGQWVGKVIQLFETTRVRHGIMLCGPTGGGKSIIFKHLAVVLDRTLGIQHRNVRFNPKAIRAQEMYGEVDPSSQEWVPGVFATMWGKYNNRNNPYNMWIIADGPVDAIWIEDLNTVLDDNKILTLANGDRMPMTDNVKIMFEVETLKNASPATVSRAGIIYVSDVELDWYPFYIAWVNRAPHTDAQKSILVSLQEKWLGDCSPISPGPMFDFIIRNCAPVMTVSRVGVMQQVVNLMEGLIDRWGVSGNLEADLEKLFLYAMAWSIGAMLETECRIKFDSFLREQDNQGNMPKVKEGETVYEYMVNDKAQWDLWRPPAWKYPEGEKLDFSNLLVPTMDSTRSLFLIETLQKNKHAVCLVGSEGTAKTSNCLMFLDMCKAGGALIKRVNYSFATKPFGAQTAVEAELDKRGGKSFGPPNGKKMTVFIDDISMPEVNNWGDQTTLELVRQLVEQGGFCFLDKDKRGDFKVCEDLTYIAAMGHPGGGKNDIPNRLKRQFFIFNLVPPSITSINDIYGQMLAGRFPKGDLPEELTDITSKLTETTILLWKTMQAKMLPTPAKFHYVFNMRDLSRVFQGVLGTPMPSFLEGGLRGQEGIVNCPPASHVAAVWEHECARVFQDKLTNDKDKVFFTKTMEGLKADTFPPEALEGIPLDADGKVEYYMVSFLREDVYDEDGVMQEEAPKIYEAGGTLVAVRERVTMFLNKYNEEFPQKKMELVLFDDAMRHLLRINRLTEMPRGSGLLVGVGGSGKQSLTRLSAYISRAFMFQITLTKTYGMNALMEDLRTLYKSAGHQRKQTCFLFTESEIKTEAFLEVINSVLMTGEVPGLFAKDEIMAITADLRPHFIKDRPGMADSQDNLKQYFTDQVRDNLHLFLCMSPLNPKFPERARRFPGLISGPTIDWFLPWPEEALTTVAKGFIENFKVKKPDPENPGSFVYVDMSCTDEVKGNLMMHMGMVHKMVTEVCDEYFEKMRRAVYQTPKSYLSFIQAYKSMYTDKLNELTKKESSVKLGLEKLIQGANDVEAMKLVLAEEDKKLAVATEETNKMLEGLEVSKADAKKEGDQVAKIKSKCEEDATRIAGEKSSAEADLAKAQPFVDRANSAIASIKPKDIGEIKANKNPTPIIQLIFDGVCILFQAPLLPVSLCMHSINKVETHFIETSFKHSGQKVLGSSNFLADLIEFGATGKDLMNEETVELLFPYLDIENFTPEVAKKASGAAEGLCIFVAAMKDYFYAARIVKPKLEALSVAMAQLDAANKALAQAEKRLKACQDKLDELQKMFEAQMAEKKRIEDGALMLAKKMQQASDLIGGLAGERERWTNDASEFAETKQRLTGDCVLGCAFVSYCGPFNQDFRNYMLADKFTADCEARNVPVTRKLNIIEFLVDIGTIGDWSMEGLPGDPLSTQNGILVTRSSRYPLLIDPQGQAVTWIKNREEERMPAYGTVLINDNKIKDKLEFAMAEGRAFVVLGVENEIDPMLDPVLEKTIIPKGKRFIITISDKQMDFDPAFMAYFITRLPNPSFSPELQAKTTVVDFTVTQKGLEEQLLGKVIGKEQRALEEQLNQVLQEVNFNTKSLLALDASLLERLTSNTGNLLEDEELIDVLANTKAKAAEVSAKLIAADETKANINEKREQFRPVATRGSVLYFAVVEMSMASPMYQTSLYQFLDLFMSSMDKAEKAALASKRVGNIIEEMTYIVYRYINRGLYERDKLTFVLIVTLKILVTAGLLKGSDVTLFLRGGAALDINSVKRKPFAWLTNDAWLNVLELAAQQKFFSNLASEMSANEAIWRRWYEDNEPEQMAIPDYENRISEHAEIGPFFKLLVLRALRMDRVILVAREFVANTPQMGAKYTEPVTDTMDMIYEEMVPDIPVIFLLSPGADPTENIETLCRKRKLPSPACISLGEGQEPVAIKAIGSAVAEGTWVVLQNCELALELMNEMEQMMIKLRDAGIDPAFRLFITCLPHAEFPLGLLQMATKVTNEPPAGLRAGILRSYTTLVDQDRLERVETEQWRQLLFALCFMHSCVQERRKFGPLGWCVPYEYNVGDITACILFLERHLYNGPISWSTFQYMVAEVQYGGKITQQVDRRIFNTYAQVWLTASTCQEGYAFNPKEPILRIPGDFQYTVPKGNELGEYRKFIETFPEVDSPEVIGLHPNADLTFRIKEVGALLSTLSETQPKGGGGGGGESREDIVYAKAAELLERLPEAYIEDDYKAKINKLGGLSVPLNIFLFQEVQRLQDVLAKVRFMLGQLQLAIKGEVVMTGELQGALDRMAEAAVPHTWTFTPAGDEFSWILPTLGLWFSSLISRDDQDRTWLNGGRPNCYWMTGWFNPTGFLTAMKQEVTRKHKADKWALDDVVYRTETQPLERADQVRAPPPEGVYVSGLFLDGAAFDKKDGVLVESEPKKLFAALPVLFVSGIIKDQYGKLKRELFGAHGPYECPVYKYRPRTDRFFIFFVTLKCTTEKKWQHWDLRGAALLENFD